MDLYFQAAAVSLAGAAFAYLIYVMMTPAQMFAPMIEDTNDKIQARIDNAVNLDISSFNNNINVPGSAILPLIQDATTNNLAVLIQTRAQRGLVANYGRQLRSPQDTSLNLDLYGYTGIGAGASDFEQNHVVTINSLFGLETGTGGKTMGANALFASSAATTYTNLTSGAPEQMGTDNLADQDDPLLHFFDPFLASYAQATQRGRTYSATGYLFTPDVLRTNMPTNDNRSYALTKGSVFYVNPGSSFYTTYVLDQTFTVVALYIEEHGCDPNGAILAEAMKANGYLTETFN